MTEFKLGLIRFSFRIRNRIRFWIRACMGSVRIRFKIGLWNRFKTGFDSD